MSAKKRMPRQSQQRESALPVDARADETIETGSSDLTENKEVREVQCANLTSNGSTINNSSSSHLSSCQDEKSNLSHLNDRLAVYVERVRSLEAENARLQVQIREVEVVERKEKENLSARYECKIDELRKQLDFLTREKAKLQMESAKAQSGFDEFMARGIKDFKKAEKERTVVQADVQELTACFNNADTTQIRVKYDTSMGKLKKAYAERTGAQVTSLRCLVDGRRVNDDDTPKSLEMEEDDVIEVYQPMVGGGPSTAALLGGSVFLVGVGIVMGSWWWRRVEEENSVGKDSATATVDQQKQQQQHQTVPSAGEHNLENNGQQQDGGTTTDKMTNNSLQKEGEELEENSATATSDEQQEQQHQTVPSAGEHNLDNNGQQQDEGTTTDKMTDNSLQKEGEEEEENSATATSDEQQEQQHQRNGVAHDGSRQTYAGRASIGSTGTTGGGRQHPVNSICTCTRCMETLNDLHSSRGYKNAESPNSTHSEGSADSGRATGHLTSYSPFADMTAELGQQAADSLPIYEFEVPNTLVGLIIGVRGKTIKELCTRADVRMLIRPHHTQDKFDSHQLCSVEGRRENINKCLHMIRLRFPPCRFPDLNLKPVLPPPLTATTKPTTASSDNGGTVQGAPTVLTLPVGVPCEVYISAHVDAGHFFVQLPTHPSFASLAVLDQYMLSVYTQPGGAPGLPKPCSVGVLCAAPAYNGWFRAITLAYDQDQDEMLVRFVDYGGFARLPRADLRQIRTDFVTLPLQGIECYLANVQPIDDSSHWSEKANELFQQLCATKIIQAALVGYCKSDGIPCVELFVTDCAKKTVSVGQILLERGVAKRMER